MLIGLLQFSPTLGDVTGNGASADALLEREGGAEGVDLLVLPELALTGGSCGIFLLGFLILIGGGKSLFRRDLIGTFA